MTPFAQLEKQAFLRGVGRGAKHIFNNGLWGNLATRSRGAQIAGRAGPVWNGVGRVSNVMRGRTGKALGGYGLAGMVSPLAGVHLPGSELALTASAPLLSAGFALPGVITAGRMAREGNQNMLNQDVMSGTQLATNDFLTAVNNNPQLAYTPGSYAHFLSQVDPNIASQANYYGAGRYTPMSNWDRVGHILSGNTQGVISDGIDQRIFGQLHKSGAAKTALRGLGKLWGGTKKVTPWLGPTAVAAGVGQASLAEKPYDEVDALGRGYAAAQSEIQKRLAGMSGWERLAARMDPSLVMRQVDQAMPGTLDRWQKQTGQVYNPGWLSRTMSAWQTGGKGKFYEYDAAGNRHYI